jgi:hypothetical protein
LIMTVLGTLCVDDDDAPHTHTRIHTHIRCCSYAGPRSRSDVALLTFTRSPLLLLLLTCTVRHC